MKNRKEHRQYQVYKKINYNLYISIVYAERHRIAMEHLDGVSNAVGRERRALKTGLTKAIDFDGTKQSSEVAGGVP